MKYHRFVWMKAIQPWFAKDAILNAKNFDSICCDFGGIMLSNIIASTAKVMFDSFVIQKMTDRNKIARKANFFWTAFFHCVSDSFEDHGCGRRDRFLKYLFFGKPNFLVWHLIIGLTIFSLMEAWVPLERTCSTSVKLTHILAVFRFSENKFEIPPELIRNSIPRVIVKTLFLSRWFIDIK